MPEISWTHLPMHSKSCAGRKVLHTQGLVWGGQALCWAGTVSGLGLLMGCTHSPAMSYSNARQEFMLPVVCQCLHQLGFGVMLADCSYTSQHHCTPV